MKRKNSQHGAQNPRNIRFIGDAKDPILLMRKALQITEMKRRMKREGNEGNAELGWDDTLK